MTRYLQQGEGERKRFKTLGKYLCKACNCCLIFVCLCFMTERKWYLQKFKKTWPVDEEIPSFRPHQIDEVVKLNNFAKRLSEGKDSSKYIFPQCAFGANGIREMVVGHMREKRRSFKDTAIQKGATSDPKASNGDTERGVTKTKTLENLRPKTRLSFRDYEN